MQKLSLALLLFAGLLLSFNSPAAARVADSQSIDELLAQPDYNGTSHAEILRLYQAIFGRYPDIGGAKYWIDIDNQGYDVIEIAGFMSASPEWSNNYSGTTNAEFVEKVYSNVLGRDYDQTGYDYWLNLVESGQLNRPEMVFYVTANTEFTDRYPFAATGTTQPNNADTLTPVQLNARRSAESYLEFSGFSRQGLIDQLSSQFGDKYELADAIAAVDSLDVDWGAQAVRSAESYLEFSGFSRQGLIDQLSSQFGSQYELADATTAVDSLDVDWFTQAVRSAESYLEVRGFSCQGLIDQLSSQFGGQYTAEQAMFGAQMAGAC